MRGARVALALLPLAACAEERPDPPAAHVAAGRAADVAVRDDPSVRHLRFHGPVQLVVGDTARRIPVTAYGADGQPVELRGGRASVGDSGLVRLAGLCARPLRSGASVITVYAAGLRASTGLHVYEPAATLDGLAGDPRLVAVPLRLAPGEMRRWPLPWGGWMLSMWPEDDGGRGLRLRVEGASCMPAPQIGPRRWLCYAGDSATVVVYAPWPADGGASPADTLVGTLAVKPSGPTRRDAR